MFGYVVYVFMVQYVLHAVNISSLVGSRVCSVHSSVLNLALDGDNCSTSRPDRFTRGEVSRYTFQRILCGPQSGYGYFGEKEPLLHQLGFEPANGKNVASPCHTIKLIIMELIGVASELRVLYVCVCVCGCYQQRGCARRQAPKHNAKTPVRTHERSHRQHVLQPLQARIILVISLTLR
jgi:hypothetical protein